MAEYIRQVVLDFWSTLGGMSPYLLFGFFFAGLLSVLISQKVVERHLGGRRVWPLIKASIFGVPLPLCSCGVIPVAMSLHKHGASKGSTISFLLSTPQTGVDSIFVTLSLLGPVFAIFRPLVALITGIIGGVLVNIFGHRGDAAPVPDKCTGACCAEHPNILSRFSHGMKYGFVTLPRDIGPAIFVGLVIAALISAFVPDNFFAEHLGTGLLAMVVMMFLGIPVYVCASASVPVAAALILKGVTPGAALVFLMTGPATNAASFVTIWKTMGHRTAVTYLLAVAGCALLSGVLLDALWRGTDVAAVTQHAEMLPAVIKNLSAVVLATILLYAFITRKKHVD